MPKDTVPQSPSPDYRRADELGVSSGLRQRDPLALAEAYHRTVPAAYACARRLLGSSDDVEALLQTVYGQLWASPPDGAGLEGWVRAHCFELGADDLRSRGAGPTSPSAASLLPDLPAPADSYLDAAERGLAELDSEQRDAVLRAHDQGIPSAQQPAENAAAALHSGLVALAGQPPERVSGDGCEDLPDLADWVLGLLAPDRAAQVEAAVAASPECGGLAQVLRAGRRRIEGLPITPDMSLRVVAVVLTDDAGGGLGRPPNEIDHLLPHVAATASAPESDNNPLPSALDQPASAELLAAADTPAADTPAAESAVQAAPAPAARPEAAPPERAVDENTSTAATQTQAGSKPLPASLRQELDSAAPDSQAIADAPGQSGRRGDGDGGRAPGADGTSASGQTAAPGGTARPTRTAGGSVAAGDRIKSTASTATGDEPASRGRRIAVIVLAVLFLVAGVALGLYIGLEGGV